MYGILQRFLPDRIAIVVAALVYTAILVAVFLFWDAQQAGFRYAEI